MDPKLKTKVRKRRIQMQDPDRWASKHIESKLQGSSNQSCLLVDDDEAVDPFTIAVSHNFLAHSVE